MRASRSQWARSRWWTCIRLAFGSIPVHLGRENHKFVFGHIARGVRAREYETAIQWIVDSGLATRVYRVDKLDNLAMLKTKLMLTEPSELLIYGTLRKEYREELDRQQVAYRVFPDRRARRLKKPENEERHHG